MAGCTNLNYTMIPAKLKAAGYGMCCRLPPPPAGRLLTVTAYGALLGQSRTRSANGTRAWSPWHVCPRVVGSLTRSGKLSAR